MPSSNLWNMKALESGNSVDQCMFLQWNLHSASNVCKVSGLHKIWPSCYEKWNMIQVLSIYLHGNHAFYVQSITWKHNELFLVWLPIDCSKVPEHFPGIWSISAQCSWSLEKNEICLAFRQIGFLRLQSPRKWFLTKRIWVLMLSSNTISLILLFYHESIHALK